MGIGQPPAPAEAFYPPLTLNGLTRLLVNGLAKHIHQPFMNQLALTGVTKLTRLPSSPPLIHPSIGPTLTAAADVFTLNCHHHYYPLPCVYRHQYHYHPTRTTIPCLNGMQILQTAPVLSAWLIQRVIDPLGNGISSFMKW